MIWFVLWYEVIEKYKEVVNGDKLIRDCKISNVEEYFFISRVIV